MMIVLTVQLDAYLNILLGNGAIRCVLGNIHMIWKNFEDVFSETIT